MRQDVVLATGETLAADVTVPADAENPWIVFLHGFGSTREGEKARRLEQEVAARGLGFVRFDFRGHGDSQGCFETLTLSRQIEDLRAVLRHLVGGGAGRPLRRAILVGSSFGGLTSAWHTALDPGPVVAQVLIAPAFRMVERFVATLPDERRRQWLAAGSARFEGPYFDFELTTDLVQDARHYDSEELLRRPAVPTTIVHGDRDDSVPVSLSQEFAERVTPSPRLVVIPGGDHRLTDHCPTLAEEIQRCLEALR